MMMTFYIAVHALVGILAFGILALPGFYFARIAKSRNVAAIRVAFAIAVKRGRIGGPLAILTSLFGIWVAYAAGYSLSAGWLIASYVVVAILVALGLGVHARWEAKVYKLALASSESAASPELRAAIDSPLDDVLNWVSLALWFALFYLMIFRPF
jgi:uncharacterized membrane protein